MQYSCHCKHIFVLLCNAPTIVSTSMFFCATITERQYYLAHANVFHFSICSLINEMNIFGYGASPWIKTLWTKECTPSGSSCSTHAESIKELANRGEQQNFQKMCAVQLFYRFKYRLWNWKWFSFNVNRWIFLKREIFLKSLNIRLRN